MTTDVSKELPPHLLRDALRRRWWIVALSLLAAVGLVFGMMSTRTPKYTATSTVLLRPLTGNSLDVNSSTNSTQVTIAMETEAKLVTSPEVAAMVSRQLSRDIVAGTPQVSALVPANTETVQITFTARNPVAAREGADAFASNFLKFRSDRATHGNSVQLQQIAEQSKDAQKSLVSAMQAAKVAHTASTDAQVQLYASRVSSLEESASQLKATGTNPGFVVSPAAAPTAPNGLSTSIYLLAAALLGLLLGGLIAVWRERSSDVIRSETEDAVAAVPILTLLPAHRSSMPVLLSDPEADEAEKDAYRRARIGTLARVTSGSVIAVSDLSRTDRAGEISANLALSLADAGHRVTVVDATFGAHDLTRLLGTTGADGLSDTLGKRELGVALALEDTHGMRFLGAGTATEHEMRDLYAGSKFRDVLDGLRKDSDIVLVAAPPATSAEGSSVAFATDGVILIAADGRTTHAEVDDIISRGGWLGIRVLGIICKSQHRRGSRREASRNVPKRSSDGDLAQPATADDHPPVADEPITASR